MSVEHIRTPSLEPRNERVTAFLREHAGMIHVHETCFPKQGFRLVDEKTGRAHNVQGVQICDGYYANSRFVDVAAARIAKASWQGVIAHHQRHPRADHCKARNVSPVKPIAWP